MPNKPQKRVVSFQFYPDDFIGGTQHFTPHEVGIYIRMLCLQATKGSIEPIYFKRICGEGETFAVVAEKFNFDDNGNYYNEKLKAVIEKQQQYAESRKNNRCGKSYVPTYDNHMLPHMNNICAPYDSHMSPHMGEGDGEGIGDGIGIGIGIGILQGDARGGIDEPEKPARPKPRHEPTEEDALLASALRNAIIAHAPESRFSSAQVSAWAHEFRKIREIDKRTGDEIREKIDWVFSEASRGSNDFWWANVVRSPKALRERWNEGKLIERAGRSAKVLLKGYDKYLNQEDGCDEQEIVSGDFGDDLRGAGIRIGSA